MRKVVKKKKRQKVDTSGMSKEALRKYRKHLADVRDYAGDRRVWRRGLKSGEILPGTTLAQYRGSIGKGRLTGMTPAQIKTRTNAVIAGLKLDHNKNLVQMQQKIEMLNRLMREVTQSTEYKKLEQAMGNIEEVSA